MKGSDARQYNAIYERQYNAKYVAAMPGNNAVPCLKGNKCEIGGSDARQYDANQYIFIFPQLGMVLDRATYMHHVILEVQCPAGCESRGSPRLYMHTHTCNATSANV